MTTMVYQYRISPVGSARDRREVLNHPAVLGQLRLAHDLSNAMVEVHLAYEKELDLVWRGHPTVGEAERVVSEIDEELGGLTARARQERGQDRLPATRAGTSAEITATRTRLRAAKSELKTAKSRAYSTVKDKIAALNDTRLASLKDLYRIFVQEQERGLHTTTFVMTRWRHDAAVALVNRARNAGRPAKLRYRRWDGGGSIAVQVQTRPNRQRRSPACIASGSGSWRNILRLPWHDPDTWHTLTPAERRRAGRGTLRWYLGHQEWVTLPVQVHRPIPADAEITMAILTRTVIAGSPRMHVNVTVKQPDPPPAEGPPAALHIGWRRRPDGSLRVGTWATGDPVTVPPHLKHLVTVDDTGRGGEIVYPARWVDNMTHPDTLRSIRDRARQPVQDMVARWLDHHPQPDPTDGQPDRHLTGAQVRQWRSPAPLAALAHRWRTTTPTGPAGADLARQLETWRRRDRLLWNREAHERDQIRSRRDDAWNNVAAWLTSHAGTVIVDDIDLTTLQTRDDITEQHPLLPPKQAAAVRTRAAHAAPGTLRDKVRNTATRNGAPVLTVAAAGLTRTHHTCGHTAKTDQQAHLSAVITCPGCGHTYDQDHNAVQLMLHRARDQRPPPHPNQDPARSAPAYRRRPATT